MTAADYMDSRTSIDETGARDAFNRQWLRISPNAGLADTLSWPTADDGAETLWPMLRLFEVSAGKVAGIELFALDDLGAAIARFDELTAD